MKKCPNVKQFNTPAINDVHLFYAALGSQALEQNKKTQYKENVRNVKNEE